MTQAIALLRRMRVRSAPSARHAAVRQAIAQLRAVRLRYKLMLLAAPLVGLLAWMLLRDSPLFSVDRVQVVGLGDSALPAVSKDLVAAARGQTTTDFSVGALRHAVARYSLIADVRAQPRPPHGVRIVVVERRPLLRLVVRHHVYLLDAEGRVVTGARAARLPVVRSAHAPGGDVSHDSWARLVLRVLAAAPAPLRARVAAVTAPHGRLTVYLHRGPRLIFGNAALPHAKWDASAAVLADPSSRGASYVNVQIPSRPAAQVADGATSGGAGSAASAPTGAATVSTLLDPALIKPSSSTSG